MGRERFTRKKKKTPKITYICLITSPELPITNHAHSTVFYKTERKG